MMKYPNPPAGAKKAWVKKALNEIDSFILESVRKGELSADIEDKQIKLNISDSFAQNFPQKIAQATLGAMAQANGIEPYILGLISSESGGYFSIPDITNIASIVPLTIPLDLEYSPPGGTATAQYGLRWILKIPFKYINYASMFPLYQYVLATIPGATLRNLQVRPLLPVELGGFYASNNAGPLGGATAPTVTTAYGSARQPYLVSPITLNQGVNNNVVNITLNTQVSQTISILITDIQDWTTPQNARFFLLVKNNKVMGTPDYSSAYPWLQIDWNISSRYYYTDAGLLTPVFLKANDTFATVVYSTATSNENLLFNGFIAYLAGA